MIGISLIIFFFQTLYILITLLNRFTQCIGTVPGTCKNNSTIVLCNLGCFHISTPVTFIRINHQTENGITQTALPVHFVHLCGRNQIITTPDFRIIHSSESDNRLICYRRINVKGNQIEGNILFQSQISSRSSSHICDLNNLGTLFHGRIGITRYCYLCILPFSVTTSTRHRGHAFHDIPLSYCNFPSRLGPINDYTHLTFISIYLYRLFQEERICALPVFTTIYFILIRTGPK